MKLCRKHSVSKPNIILLHGGPGAVGELHDLALELDASGLAVAEHFQNAFSINGLLGELKELIATETAGEKAILIGHSWGAWLGWIFAANHPDKVKGLIMVASGSLEPDFNIDLTKRRIEKLSLRLKSEAIELLEKLKKRHVISDNDFRRLGELMEKADTYSSAVTENPVKATVMPNQHQVIWDEAQQMRRSGELLDLSRKIMCPVVAFHGDFDSHPVSGVEIPLREKIADFRLILLKACGHYPWREKYAKDVFLEKLKAEIAKMR